jgi:hypothetical protein
MKPNYWLVDALVERLQPVVPEGFTIFASPSGERLEISSTEPPVFGTSVGVKELVEQNAEVERNIETAIRSALDGIQIHIVEDLGSSWPPVEQPDPKVEPLDDSPPPNASVKGDVVHVWFGDEDQPDLVLEPIPVQRQEAR